MFRKGDARLCITLFVRAVELTYEEIMANNDHERPSDSVASVAPSQHNHRDHTQQLLVKFKQRVNPTAAVKSV